MKKVTEFITPRGADNTATKQPFRDLPIETRKGIIERIQQGTEDLVKKLAQIKNELISRDI